MPILIEYEFLLILLMFFFYFFIYGSIGFLPQKNNILRILFFFEMLILVISFLFLIITLHYNDIYGHLVVMYLLTIAAVEAAVGLALLYLYYRAFGSIRLQSLSKIKG
jgi:NADH-quinone oxidoreductase subunit K